MSDTFPVLLDGYTDLPAGKIANVVTFLERTDPPPTGTPSPGFVVRTVIAPTTAWYRALYTRIGQDQLWFSRAVMTDAALGALIWHPAVRLLAVEKDGVTVGFAELSRTDNETEIVTFGVVPEATGTGAAQALMTGTLEAAFVPGVARVWLHTCTFDHPAALRFYGASGFRAYKIAIEVCDDPRVTGALPADAAPQFPVLGSPARR